MPLPDMLPDTIDALNIGTFPMSQEFTEAGHDVLRDIYGFVTERFAGYLAVAGAIEELHDRDGLSSRIVASYLETVVGHAASVGANWYVKEDETSPLVQIQVAISNAKSGEEGNIHRDYEGYTRRGMRLVVVNRATTIVDGVSSAHDGEIIRTIHGHTWHNAPPFNASRQSPRLRLHTDFYLHDPRKMPRN